MFSLLQKFVNAIDWRNLFLCLMGIVLWTMVLAGILMILNLTGCKTFEPVTWNDKLPPECNMSLNTYKLYYNSTDKSAVVPESTFCYKKLHRLFCQEEVYGKNKDGSLVPVDYNDAKKYRDYEQCKSEIR